MNDPFYQIESREGSDAPDLQVRMAQLKAQQGQPLTHNERRRVAVRQGIETEAAKQNQSRIDSGFDPVAPVRVSIAQGLAGTGLDPVLAGARVQAARLATDPVAAANFRQTQELASYGLQGLTPGTPGASDALADAQIRIQTAASTGLPLSQVDRMRLVGTVPPPSEQPAPLAPPAVPPVSAPVGTSARVKAAIPKEYEPNAASKEAVLDNEWKRRYGGQPVTISQAAAQKEALRKELEPTVQTRNVVDPLTQDNYEVSVLADRYGNVYQRGDPVFKTPGPFKSRDTEFQKDVNEWVDSGDGAKARIGVNNLLASAADLTSGKFSAASGPVLSLIPEALRVRMFPQATNVQTSIENEALKGMKSIFGSRVTNTDLVQTLARTFDVRLPQEVNAARAVKLAQNIKAAADAKDAAVNYFTTHGTLAGYTGKIPTLEDVVSDASGAGKPEAKIISAKDAYLSQFKQ